jgi:autotransporter-associated beta strand protein
MPKATRTWRLEPTSDLWSVGTNWTTNVAPVADDSLVFGVTAGPTTLTNDITAGTQFSGITFNAGASAYTLTGNQITLGGSVINNSANLQTIALPLDLAASCTFATNSGGITVSGAITSTGGITKDGRDTLTLAGTNTFSGNIAVRGGTRTGNSGFLLILPQIDQQTPFDAFDFASGGPWRWGAGGSNAGELTNPARNGPAAG